MKVSHQQNHHSARVQSLPKTPNKQLAELAAELDRLEPKGASPELYIRPKEFPTFPLLMGSTGAALGGLAVDHLASHSLGLGGFSGAVAGLGLAAVVIYLTDKLVDIPCQIRPLLGVLGTAGGFAAGVALASAGLGGVAGAAAGATFLGGPAFVQNGDG